jgi:tetratricopeptide (TPR) repeat protein
MALVRTWVVVSLSGLVLVTNAAAQVRRDSRTDVLAALDREIAAAEASLRAGEMQVAESHYRSALREGWLIAGALHAAAGDLPRAREAFRQASIATVDADAAEQSLALVHLQLRESTEAVAILSKLAARQPSNLQLKRLLAQALIANGRPEEAVQALEEARASAPDDPEIAFLLATGYLHVKKVAEAERLFARVTAARPMPQTYVLIGRTYRDAGLFDRARTALQTALRIDPNVRRAHYYLGTAAVMADGVLRLDEAIREFRLELKVSPKDPMTNLRLGVALVEARRPAEALPALQIATRSTSAPPDAFHYLGRCQLALDRPADAVTSLRRALELSQVQRVDDDRLGNIQYQLAVALRRTGATSEAAVHFEEAQRASARRADADRERLRQYLGDLADPEGLSVPTTVPLESPLSALSPSDRAVVEQRVTDSLARAYLNLGVMQAQRKQFARAAEFFEQAAAVNPAFPQVQYSLGVAYFNAQQYERAAAPLERAREADPANAEIQRMLALTFLNSDAYEKAAELLATDPQREADAALQYAYALALVRGNRPTEAETVFARLLAAHGATPELSVLMGQAYAHQGDYEGAIQSLQRALQLKSDIGEANATLGLIYLKQGKLQEARAALRAELEAHPGNTNAAQTLATVLDLEGDQEQAIALLRSVLARRPDFANARYLLGKILLARGAAEEAIEHLQAGAKFAPEDANIHFQLSQAYRKAGRTQLADREFEIYRQIKDKRRTP